MSYRSERFNKSMRSVEESANGIDMSKWRVLSDWGIGVERMIDEIDGDEKKVGGVERKKVGGESRWTMDGQIPDAEEAGRDERLWEAEMRLADAGKGYLIRVLLLIVENGADRETSLRSVARATYFRHREELLDFFS